MKYLKFFESYNNDIISVVDDIAGLIETYQTKGSPAGLSRIVGEVLSKWALPDFQLNAIYLDEKYKGQRNYINYFVFAFYDLTNFYNCDSSINKIAKRNGLKYFIVNEGDATHKCHFICLRESDWKKLDIDGLLKNINKAGWDVLFEEDLTVNKDDFEVLYDDDDIIATKPKNYRAAIKYSADAHWKIAFKKDLEFIEKHLQKGSYYGGFNWYRTKKITKEVDSWWRRILRLPKKKVEEEVKEFANEFPRYLLYIVDFKKYSIDDPYRKLYLLYDISRSEYGEVAKSFSFDYVMFGGYWGDKLDSAHNQLKIRNAGSAKTGGSQRITLRDIFEEHGHLFNRAFREIEADMNSIKEELNETLGIWADIGGEYREDALMFIRDKENKLHITTPNLLNKDGSRAGSFTSLGRYDDPNFDWWKLNTKKPVEREIPKYGYKDFFASISTNVQNLKDALDKGWKL